MHVKLTIPTPCHEDFNKMTPTEKGKFCKQCNKEVIDFTELSNRAVSLQIKQGKSLCGRFKVSQLNQEFELHQTNRFPRVAAAVVLASTLFSVVPSFAQKSTEKVTQSMLQKAVLQQNDSLEKFILFKGKVNDDTGELPGVKVTLKGTSITSETDFHGNFSIKIPNTKRKSIILVFSYLGYEQKEIDILTLKKPLIVTLQEDASILGGMVAVGGYVVVEKKSSIFKRIGNLFKKKKNRKN